jgi:hypothetical protein
VGSVWEMDTSYALVHVVRHAAREPASGSEIGTIDTNLSSSVFSIGDPNSAPWGHGDQRRDGEAENGMSMWRRPRLRKYG